MFKQPYREIDHLSIDENLTIKYKGKVLETYENFNGYLEIYIDDIDYKQTVHRIVAKAFIPTKDFRKDIHHKDGNKLNNSVENLEWLSRKNHIEKHNRPIHQDTHVGLTSIDKFIDIELPKSMYRLLFLIVDRMDTYNQFKTERDNRVSIMNRLEMKAQNKFYLPLKGLLDKDFIRKISKQKLMINPNYFAKCSKGQRKLLIEKYKKLQGK